VGAAYLIEQGDALSLVVLFVVMCVLISVCAFTGREAARQKVLQSARGPCDRVTECGEYRCAAGVEGWHIP